MFDPDKDDSIGIDEYHLFHFDEAWMEELLAEYFLLEDRTPSGPNQAFYVYRKIEGLGAASRGTGC